MQLWELNSGDKVTLELVMGTVVYPINAVVHVAASEGVFIKALYKDGQVLDLSHKSFSQAVFNLYAYLDKGSSRIVWKGVTVKLHQSKNQYYYVISVNTFARNSTDVNRRGDARVTLFSAGTIILNEENSYTVLMKDISNSGVAFTIGENLPILGESFPLDFSDEVNGRTYNLSMKCRAVRKVPQQHGFLVGCVIEEGNKELLFYTYQKILAAKALEKSLGH